MIIRSESSNAVPDARTYRSFADLANAQLRGRDFEISITRRHASRVAVIAPHAGEIEDGTSELARAIAGDDHNLYLFEGIRPEYNYRALHLTSHLFDEPECLALIADCTVVVAVHGCAGLDDRLFVGGRDTGLRDRLAAALLAADHRAETAGHRYPAVHPNNVCNRGATGRGAQIELPHSLRRGGAAHAIAAAVRAALSDPPRAQPACSCTVDQLLSNPAG